MDSPIVFMAVACSGFAMGGTFATLLGLALRRPEVFRGGLLLAGLSAALFAGWLLTSLLILGGS